MRKLPRGSIVWALYDFANTGYAMVALALIFPRLYKTFWGSGLTADKQTFFFNMTVAAASLLVAVLAPLLGNIAELGGIRKKLLLRFATLGIVACGSLHFVGEGDFLIASAIYILGTVSFYSANIFFDSMLADVSTPRNRHFISGLAFSFGYSAGFLILLTAAILLARSESLGFASPIDVSRFLFLFAAAWWALFTLPLVWKFKDERRTNPYGVWQTGLLGIRATWATFKEILGQHQILWFLLAYLFYIDGVNTIITTASNYGSTLGFTEGEIITAFFCVQIAGVPCAVLIGLIAQKTGAKSMLLCAIATYLVVTFYGAFLSTTPRIIFGYAVPDIYILALMIGMVQGGVQALSRSFFTSLIPEGKTVAYFGFYSMIGKSAAILGPMIMGSAALLFYNPDNPTLSTRIGMGSVAILFVIGGLCLLKVKGKGNGLVVER